MKKIVTSIFLLVMAIAFSVSALKAQDTKKADKHFASEEYYKAAEVYKAAVADLSGMEAGVVQYRIGECYRRMNNPEEAVKWFTEAEKNGYKKPDLLYSNGEMLTMLGDYKKAQSYFQRYRSLNPDDARVAHKLSAIDFALTYPKVNPYFTLKPVETLNTTGSEYGIAYYNDNLVYASTGDVKPSTNEANVSMRTGLGYSKFYMSVFQDGGYQPGFEVKEFSMERSNDGTFSYDPHTKMAYYTRCRPTENECSIYYAEYVNGKWKEKGQLKIDGKPMQIAHPCVAPDGKRIYFSGIIENGYGGSDIWYIEKDSKGAWGKAINAGREINTVGNEVFPFIIETTLYFSSDGRDGYGGLDVYAARINQGSHGKAVNLRPPFNTSYDDFNLIVHPEREEGMLVSNRRNSKSNDDIFSFDGRPIVLLVSGYVFDKETEAPIPNAVVELSDDDDDVEVVADSTGYYYAFLKPKVEYTLSSEEKGYSPETKQLSTSNADFPMEFCVSSGYDMDFYLKKMQHAMSGKVYDMETKQVLVNEPVYLFADGQKAGAKRTDSTGVYSFENLKPGVLYKVKVENNDYLVKTKELKFKEGEKTLLFALSTGFDMDLPLEKIHVDKEIVIDNIYYDLNKATLLPESKVELDKLIGWMKENPRLIVQISSHTDSRGSDSYNQKLSEARAKSVVDYLTDNGIAPRRLTAKGYGKSNLLVKNAQTEEEHRKNRRTTFKVTGVEAMAAPDFDSFNQEETPKSATSTPSTVPVETSAATDQDAPFTVQVSLASRLDMTDPKIRKIEKELGTKVWYEKTPDNRYRYYVGRYRDRDQAVEMVNKLKEIGIKDSFVKDLRR